MSETKELVIEARIPLPDDYFEESEVAAKVKVAADAFRDDLEQTLGNDGFKLVVARETPAPPKKTRQPRSDIGATRAARAGATVNGAAENPSS